MPLPRRETTNRAYTNPFSNTIVLPKFSLGEGLDTHARKPLPLRCVPQFLHEVMHHWCFDSPVGTAITLLKMRQRRAAISPASGDRFKLVEDCVRVSCFLEFARPVLEGLALFAEHDLIVGDSEIISNPAFLTAFMFMRHHDENRNCLTQLPNIIASSRLTSAHIRRKANLYLQPITGEKAGYLPGYLYIRLIFRIVAERCSSYNDPDLFVHALRCWLFDDWELVHLLLNDTIHTEDWLEQFGVYWQQRLNKFIDISEETLRDFQTRGASGQADQYEYKGEFLNWPFYTYPVIVGTQRGKQSFSSILDELFKLWPTS